MKRFQVGDRVRVVRRSIEKTNWHDWLEELIERGFDINKVQEVVDVSDNGHVRLLNSPMIYWLHKDHFELVENAEIIENKVREYEVRRLKLVKK